MDGVIRLSSHRFPITPVLAQRAVRAMAASEKGGISAMPSGGGTDIRPEPLVLIIDDDRGIRDALTLALSDQGVRCLTAGNGAEALTMLRRVDIRPDLILLDLMMPVMSGWEFRLAQLADPTLAALPVAVLSAVPDATARAPELSLDRFIRKPIDLDALYGLIRDLVPGWTPQD